MGRDPSPRPDYTGPRMPPVRVFSPLPLLALFGVMTACSANDLGGECATDGDCADNEVCLLDVKSDAAGEALAFTYCTTECASDAACSADRSCREGSLATGRRSSLCVDRVRSCGDEDPPNGLDDDCDGATDEDALPVTEGCLDDARCGGFVCRAPPDGADTVCGPPNASSVANFGACEGGDQCRNGLCVAGLCTPTCRFGGESCRGVQVDSRERPTVCAQHIDEVSRPTHNACQIECSRESCPEGSSCVWRDVVGTMEGQHLFVCSELDPNRLPLGASCPSNSVEDDLRCQHGLCFGFTCTRRCAGPGDDCSDVGANLSCLETTLIYGLLEFRASICRTEGGS